MKAVHIVTLLAIAVLVLVVLPRVIFPLGRVEGNWLDRAMAGGVAMTALIVASMYLLGAFGLLETPALVAVCALTWWVLKGRRAPRYRLARLAERALTFSDDVEANGRRAVGSHLPRVGPGRVREQLRRRWADRPSLPTMVICLTIVAVLVTAALLRFARAVEHIDLVPQDSYLALSWTTFLNHGEILADGTYPQGTYMWMSMLDRLYPFDVYTFTRYAGPLMNVFELIALYWVTSRITRSKVAGLLSLAVFGLFAGNPALLVVWSRQIGAMTQEFALAFGLVSLTFAGRYLARRSTADLVLAGAALFVGTTSNSLVIPLLALGYAVLLGVGLLTAGWTRQTFLRMVVVGVVAVVAANLYIPLGLARGIPLNKSFDLYNPAGRETFETAEVSGTSPATRELSTNALFQFGVIGAALGVVTGLVLLRRSPDRGRILLAMAGTALAAIVLYDTVVWRAGLLFRVRQGWITAEILCIALGIGIGSLVLLLSSIADPRTRRRPTLLRWRPPHAFVEPVALVLAALFFLALWPRYSAAAREVGSSGFPQATEVSLKVIRRADPLTFTFVGVAEQYQEAIDKGFFTEAWVFARDITFSEARDPAYELPIPTRDVYVFAEKVAFAGPQAPRPYGPTQEFYRDQTRRARMMRRILLWCEAYSSAHRDVDVVYDDAVLRVYRISRRVDTVRADLSPTFKDYSWRPGEIFDDDGDVSANVIVPNPDAADNPPA